MVKGTHKINGRSEELEQQLNQVRAELRVKREVLGLSVAHSDVDPGVLSDEISRLEGKEAALEIGLSTLKQEVRASTEQEQLERTRAEVEKLSTAIEMATIELIQDLRTMLDRSNSIIENGRKLPLTKPPAGMSLPQKELALVSTVYQSLDRILSQLETMHALSPQNSLLSKAGLQRRSGKPVMSDQERRKKEAKLAVDNARKLLEHYNELKKQGANVENYRIEFARDALVKAERQLKSLGG